MNNILIVSPSWVGDMVMAQSLFKIIKQQTPEANISVLAPQWCETILHRMPEVTDVIYMPVGHGALNLGMRWKLGKKLRKQKFDQAIVLPGSFKSALIPWFAKIPKRTGFVGEQRWGLLNDIRHLDKKATPQNVQRYITLAVDKMDKNISNTIQPPYPSLIVNLKKRNQAIEKFGLNSSDPILALCPGAEYGPAKRWPKKYFADVARQKHQNGWQVWIFGSENDKDIAQRINGMTSNICSDLTARTTLGEAVDLMSCAKIVVTNDSGLMHVAAAIGSHVIALYGSSSDGFTPPLTEKCDRLNLKLSCSPCFKRECPLGHLNCLNQMTPEKVLELIH